ncbi:DUF2059 domain-containing protein [Acinetobacter sp. ANC 3791]|uniref:DUF2059 domain-containing protein n=1 Tax=Acinetobacter sp. ANC 3791 TaxID=2529836 RepID=UPI00103D9F97|nr:DUF2059 domain-containing protein [Acinetobacter sp. ANC 3791]TCB84138.1 DUF2059 domain-containing protein [Acinetobacter sp. ANC 3791]
MQLKSISQILTLLGGMFFFDSSHAQPASPKSIDQLFDILQIKQNTQSMVKPQQLQTLGLNKEQFWQDVEPQLKQLYQKNLSEEEVQALNRFYRTPEGQSLAAKMPTLSQETYNVVVHSMMNNSAVNHGLFKVLGIDSE